MASSGDHLRALLGREEAQRRAFVAKEAGTHLNPALPLGIDSNMPSRPRKGVRARRPATVRSLSRGGKRVRAADQLLRQARGARAGFSATCTLRTVEPPQFSQDLASVARSGAFSES